MVTIRCTQKLLRHLGITPDESPEPPTGALGDWYANLIPTVAGELIIFVNERSLLTVAVPERETENLIEMFRARVVNLFAMIGVSLEGALRELKELDPIQFGRTTSRSVLGSMNDIAWNYQVMAEQSTGKGKLSLSDAELGLSGMPCGPIGYRFPADVAKELLGETTLGAR
jgi:hypothetical protein